MSGSGESASALTVLIAFGANFAVAVAKSVAAGITGSASMVAEAAHSWADTGNQVFLLVADRKSRRGPDRSQPLGYGREAYVWSLFAALGLFIAGGVVSVYHGVHQLTAGEAEASYGVGYVVLAVAFCFEGVSFAQAFRRTRLEARAVGRDVLDHALATSDPTLRAVLAEDSAACLGLVLAAAGMFLHQRTGEAAYDAAGSIAIGLLLCLVALVLIDRNRRFLTGQVADPEIHRAALARIYELPGVHKVTYVRLEYLGPRQLMLVASVDLEGDDPERLLATRLRDLERRLETDPRIVESVLTLATEDEEKLPRPSAAPEELPAV